jgi:hypothetical protein
MLSEVRRRERHDCRTRDVFAERARVCRRLDASSLSAYPRGLHRAELTPDVDV